MGIVKSSQKSKNHKITFSINAPEANQVMLMGDFNNWDRSVHPMKKNGKGVWTKMLLLPPRQYQYKFLVDGEWREDPANGDVCANCFGTRNNLLNLS